MTLSPNPTMVAGERVELLARALVQFKLEDRADGTCHFDAIFEPAEGAPLCAALMRVEAELLLHEAEAVSAGETWGRRPTERRAEALTELARRVGAAYLGKGED